MGVVQGGATRASLETLAGATGTLRDAVPEVAEADSVRATEGDTEKVTPVAPSVAPIVLVSLAAALGRSNTVVRKWCGAGIPIEDALRPHGFLPANPDAIFLRVEQTRTSQKTLRRRGALSS